MSRVRSILCLALLNAVVLPLSGAETSNLIRYVSVRSVPETSFKRISEYFDQQENLGGNIILRSQPNHRAGYYFILSLAKSAADVLANGMIELHYFREGENLHILETFELPSPIPDSKEIWLGLTGSSDIGPNASILAWKIVTRNANGAILGSKKSFLWELPPEN